MAHILSKLGILSVYGFGIQVAGGVITICECAYAIIEELCGSVGSCGDTEGMTKCCHVRFRRLGLLTSYL